MQHTTTLDQFPRRRERLARIIADEGLDLLVVSNPVNVSYLTNFSGDSSWLILGSKATVMVSDGRFTQQLAEECPGLVARIRPPQQPVQDAACEAIKLLGARAVAFESGHLSVADFESLKTALPAVNWKGGMDRIEKLRAVKDQSEIEQIRQAIDMAERAFRMFLAELRPEHSEKYLSDSMEMYVRRAGGRCTSFPSIVAAGARAALPHCPPAADRVGDAHLLLVDWGASGRFYKSDLTRVLAPRTNSRFSGLESGVPCAPKLQQVYDVVLRAQLAAIEALRPGAKSGDIDAAARQVIADAGFGDYFTHSVGHGLGIQVHEAPMMRAGTETILQAGMVVTVEPGIYLPDWGGIRIEDDVLITPDGREVLTHLPKEAPTIF